MTAIDSKSALKWMLLTCNITMRITPKRFYHTGTANRHKFWFFPDDFSGRGVICGG